MAITEQKKRTQRIQMDLVLFLILYLMGGQFFIHLGAVLPNYPNFNIVTQLDPLIEDASAHALKFPYYFGTAQTLNPFYIFSFFSFIILTLYLSTRRKMRPGEEYGGSRWGKPSEIRRMKDRKNADQNMIFTETEHLSLNMRKTKRNNNTLIIGDSGAGKNRNFLKPNIMQLHTSYILTDPKGELLQDTGSMLEKAGYTIKVFNLMDMAHSCCYSPFKYIKEEEDIEKMIKCLIKNTTPINANQSDPYWEKAESLLLKALCAFIYYKLPEEEQNFSTVMRLMRMLKISEEEEDYEADLDLLFKKLEEEDPNNLAVKTYKDFKAAAGKTLKSIVTQVNARLSPFNYEKVENLMHKDTLNLERIPEERVAFFIIIPDSDKTFHFLAAMLYYQMFELYSKMAFKQKGKRLKKHVRFLMDEFANIGVIPDFAEQISTMRSKNFSAALVLQNITQLEKGYKDDWKTIVNNCNTKLYLAGDEKDSTKYISEMLGKETIEVKNNHYQRGRNRSISENYQKIGRALMEPDEIGRMPDTDCILFIKGKYPYYSNKYDIRKHKNYKSLFDGEVGVENFYDYTTFITPKKQTEEALDVKKTEKPKEKKETKRSEPLENYNLKDLQVNVGTIKKLRYAVEFESF